MASEHSTAPDSNTDPDGAESGRNPTAAPGSPRRSLMGGRGLAAVVAVALGALIAVVIVNNTNDTNDTNDTNERVAGRDVAATVDASEGAPALTGVETTGSLQLSATTGDPAGGTALEIADPSTPSGNETAAKHCLLVTYTGTPGTVEGYGCHEAAGGSSTVQLSAPGSPVIGCAGTVTRTAVAAGATGSTHSEFKVLPASSLPAGDYRVTFEVVSGVGDGCAPADDGQAENIGTLAAELRVP